MAAVKLTLSVKPDSLPLVKNYAKRKHTSVSKLVQQFFDGIAEEEVADQPTFKLSNDLPQWIKDLTLSDKPTPDFDHKVEYGKHIEKKYGL